MNAKDLCDRGSEHSEDLKSLTKIRQNAIINEPY